MSSIFLRMLNTLTSIALDFFAREPRFIAMVMADWLSCHSTVGSYCLNPISAISVLNPSTSQARRYASVSSADVVDSSVVVCRLEVKLTAAPFIITCLHPCERGRVNDESANPTSLFHLLLSLLHEYFNPMCLVEYPYSNAFSRILKCSIPHFVLCRLRTDIA